MFILILCVMTVLLGAGLYWMTGRWLSFYGIDVKKRSVRLLRIGFLLLVFLLCRLWRMTGLIVVHLIVLFVAVELAAFFIRHFGREHRETRGYQVARRIYLSGLVPVIITCVLLGYGAYNMNHIVSTEYTVTTDKVHSDYKVVLITDTHYGTIQSPDVLKSIIEEINAQRPDLIVLGGDIVEEGTSKVSMEDAFQVFGKLKSTYGTYYMYGNHDRQDYADAKSRTYTEEELLKALQSNGITALRDEWVSVGEELILAGRDDAGRMTGRASVEDLLKDTDRGHFLITVDHQPVEVEENAEAGVDLLLSGHTHAGQIFPVGYFTDRFLGPNYGRYEEGGCTLIVSSGATGWGFPVRTQGKCEYVVVDITS